MKYRYIYDEYLCLKIMTAAKRPKLYFNNFNEYKGILCFWPLWYFGCQVK